MLSDDTFEFTTSFGRKKLYLFSDITDLKKNLNKYDRDSRILCVAHKKIFISDLAFVSDRFEARVQRALTERQRPCEARRTFPIPQRNWPVMLSRFILISCGVPLATIRPPASPPPGPISMT